MLTPLNVAAAAGADEYTVVSGTSGTTNGYIRGSLGSLTPENRPIESGALINNFTTQTVPVTQALGLEGNLPNNNSVFTQLEILDGPNAGTYLRADANYNAGATTFWDWPTNAIMFGLTTKFRIT